MDLLDARTGAFRWRLFRDACVAFEGNYVKDLQCLGRPLSDSIIVDNSPHSYVFQPDNAVPVSTFIDDPADTELLQILPLLLALPIICLLTVLVGQLSSRGVHDSPPLEVLRSIG